ncbi:Putative transport protein YhhT [Polaromonas vacuolata]|uniref:Transport protein YhhT n=1 Tax=Polaromonas vacuolata TaxID=37448 RepID=A0A6H2H6J3_9BURK|nr:AI-2E family transporter [Polaromonas vacuolata]QJC55475.1 Putative transport protein YhhT [Polaromonas vacuolata]
MTLADKMSDVQPDNQPARIPASTEDSTGSMSAKEKLPVQETEPLIQLPMHVRSLSLLVMALFASLWVLQWARAVFIPLMLGLILSYALSPVINWLEQRRMPRWLSAALLLLTIFCSIGSSAYVLSDEAGSLINAIPAATQKFTHALKDRPNKSEGTLATMQKAATQLEQATQDASPITTSKGAMRVVVESPRFKITDYLWTSTLGFAQFAGQFTVVVFLTYFLMVSGDTFRRKLIKLTGTSRARKKITLQVLDEITGQIQRYLQVQLFTSALVGLLTGLALALIGLENAVVWGVVAAVLNLVPYIGSLAMAAASSLIGFLQFGSINMALLVGGASLFIHAIIGNLITPWLTSRASRMNPVAVFVGLLSWGWLWGVWGLLLGIPILMIVKAICDRVDELKPVGEFLGA